MRTLHARAFLMAQMTDVVQPCRDLETLARANDLAAVAAGFPDLRRQVMAAIDCFG